jgi:histidyl-tRNA synthetase
MTKQEITVVSVDSKHMRGLDYHTSTRKCFEWLKQNIGPIYTEWTYCGGSYFGFFNEDDAVAFMLVFC